MSDVLTIRVPATTANLGPGFDCLGMALSLWNTVRVGWADRPTLSCTGWARSTCGATPAT